MLIEVSVALGGGNTALTVEPAKVDALWGTAANAWEATQNASRRCAGKGMTSRERAAMNFGGRAIILDPPSVGIYVGRAYDAELMLRRRCDVVRRVSWSGTRAFHETR